MKMQRLNFRKITTMLLFVTTLMILFSCKGQEKKSKEQNEEISVLQTIPPSLDIHAATFMGNLEAVNQHIKARSDLNKKDQYGSTPLTIAATFNKTEVAIALINAGADLNMQSTDGSTPLHTSAFFCRIEIVEALLEKGADKTLRNNYGSSPLESVSAPFNDVKNFYDQISKDLGPFGFKLDYKYLETTRPLIAEMLQSQP